MQIQPLYNRIDAWMQTLSSIEYALLAWLIAFSTGILLGVMILGDTFLNAVPTAVGSATGLAVVFYLTGMPEE
ncbi:hypothetical protein [Halocatena halophila]|uniref:hypothetical protein n=1 Tax=Halocatena halophila TaxID=2814576 RepID=UPI002ED55385